MMVYVNLILLFFVLLSTFYFTFTFITPDSQLAAVCEIKERRYCSFGSSKGQSLNDCWILIENYAMLTIISRKFHEQQQVVVFWSFFDVLEKIFLMILQVFQEFHSFVMFLGFNVDFYVLWALINVLKWNFLGWFS
jgi:hypothetical protein